MKNSPFFSIIVVSYNAEDTIKDTVESILTQSYGDFEIIIKDARSKDNTLHNIPTDSRIRIFSCEDSGIYDGMSQGIQYARGRYLSFMNCGDHFENPEVLQRFYDAAFQFGGNTRMIFYGDVISGSIIRKFPIELSKKFLIRNPLCHQAMLFGRDVFSECGFYDCRYRLMADYDLTLNAFCRGIPFLHTDQVVCRYQGGGVSATQTTLLKKERKEIIKHYFTSIERFEDLLVSIATMRQLRIWLESERSPFWLRQLYGKAANVVNSRS